MYALPINDENILFSGIECRRISYRRKQNILYPGWYGYKISSIFSIITNVFVKDE